MSEASVRATLAALGLAHEEMACDPDFADTAVFCERYGIDPQDSANAIIVVGKSEPRRYVCCLVLSTTRLDVNGAVRRRLGVKKASFASGEETKDLTGMMIGGVTPFGLPDDLPIWIDARVAERPSVIVGGGSRSLKIRVAPSVFASMPNAEFVDELATEPPASD